MYNLRIVYGFKGQNGEKYMVKILTFGVFDYFHLGHLRLFQQCKEYADYLIVAVQDADYILKFKPNATILYSTEERVEILQELRVVDKVVVYETVGVAVLKKIDFVLLMVPINSLNVFKK